MQASAVLIGTTLFVAVPSLAQDHARADPDHVKVVAENDKVRVLRYGPREKSAQHSHPDNTVDVALTKGTVRLLSPDGKIMEHTVALAYLVPKLPLKFAIAGTIPLEQAGRRVDNNRITLLSQFKF